jgi:hypothetical protein
MAYEIDTITYRFIILFTMKNSHESLKKLSEKIDKRETDFSDQDLEAVGLADRVSILMFILSSDFRKHTLTVAEILDQNPHISSLSEEDQEAYLSRLMPDYPGYDMDKLAQEYQIVQDAVDEGDGNLGVAIKMGLSEWIYTGIKE